MRYRDATWLLVGVAAGLLIASLVVGNVRPPHRDVALAFTLWAGAATALSYLAERRRPHSAREVIDDVE